MTKYARKNLERQGYLIIIGPYESRFCIKVCVPFRSLSRDSVKLLYSTDLSLLDGLVGLPVFSSRRANFDFHFEGPGDVKGSGFVGIIS